MTSEALQKKKNRGSLVTSAVLVGVLFVVFVARGQGFSEPTNVPPSGNIPQSITTGGAPGTQIKSGQLEVNDLFLTPGPVRVTLGTFPSGFANQAYLGSILLPKILSAKHYHLETGSPTDYERYAYARNPLDSSQLGLATTCEIFDESGPCRWSRSYGAAPIVEPVSPRILDLFCRDDDGCKIILGGRVSDSWPFTPTRSHQTTQYTAQFRLFLSQRGDGWDHSSNNSPAINGPAVSGTDFDALQQSTAILSLIAGSGSLGANCAFVDGDYYDGTKAVDSQVGFSIYRQSGGCVLDIWD